MSRARLYVCLPRRGTRTPVHLAEKACKAHQRNHFKKRLAEVVGGLAADLRAFVLGARFLEACACLVGAHAPERLDGGYAHVFRRRLEQVAEGVNRGRDAQSSNALDQADLLFVVFLASLPL